MAYGLPSIGEGNWGQKILDSFGFVKGELDGRLSPSSLTASYASRFASAQTAANTRRLMNKLRRGVSDASILIVSDSTGDAVTEWAYLTADALGAEFPAYSVIVKAWDQVGEVAYSADDTRQVGTGAKTLTVWLAARGGSTPGYFQGSRWATAIVPSNPDLVILNHGHNLGDPTGTGWDDNGANAVACFLEEVAALFPRAGFLLLGQNPSKRAGRETWQQIKANAYEQYATLRGYGFIDVGKAFEDYGNWQADLMADDTHPNSTGQALWADVVTSAFTATDTPASMVLLPPPLLGQAKNYLPNGDFSSWTSGSPDNWNAQLVTVTQETSNVETGAYAAALTASASAGQAYLHQTVTLASAGYRHLRGQVVTLAVRLYVPASNTDIARVQLLDSTGDSRSMDVPSLGMNTARDRYVWVFVTKRIASDATTISSRIMARASGGSSATVGITVDRATLVVGALPSEAVTAVKGDTGSTGPAGPAGTGGLSQFDFLSTLGDQPLVATSAGSGGALTANAANEAVLVKVKPLRDVTITKMSWMPSVSSGNYDIGIYDAAGTRLWSKGSTAWATGFTTETVSPSVSLTGGTTYYVAFAADNTTGTIRGTSSSADIARLLNGDPMVLRVASSFPLPATITPGSTAGTRFPFVVLREA